LTVNGAPSIWPALLAFVAVIAMIPAVMWVLKKLQGGLNTGSQGLVLRSGLALGPRERVAVIDVQGRRFLVGVTAQTVNLIAELDATGGRMSELSPDTLQQMAQTDPNDGFRADAVPVRGLTPTANGFAELLSRLKRP